MGVGNAMARDSKRAEAIMRRALPEQRSKVRVPLHLSAGVRYGGGAEHLALVRDISASGVFFYSDFEPHLETHVQIVLTVPVAGRNVQVICRGTVVRIEPSASKAVGVAALLQWFDFSPLAA